MFLVFEHEMDPCCKRLKVRIYFWVFLFSLGKKSPAPYSPTSFQSYSGHRLYNIENIWAITIQSGCLEKAWGSHNVVKDLPDILFCVDSAWNLYYTNPETFAKHRNTCRLTGIYFKVKPKCWKNRLFCHLVFQLYWLNSLHIHDQNQ